MMQCYTAEIDNHYDPIELEFDCDEKAIEYFKTKYGEKLQVVFDEQFETIYKTQEW